MNNKLAKEHFTQYWPLISLILGSMLTAFALNWRLAEGATVFMHYFMGVFLVFFSLLKIFQPKKFADGFTMYDILAKRIHLYAYIYIFIEFSLGLMYLSLVCPVTTYMLTIFVMSFGSIGVLLALKDGLDINCPCMGSALKVPLSTVTLTEDLGMIAMALILLLKSLL